MIVKVQKMRIVSAPFQPQVQRIDSSKGLVPRKVHKSINFCAGESYEQLLEANPVKLRYSSFFRRGCVKGRQSPEFQDVIDALGVVFSKTKKPKMLFVGLGDGAQEFLSDVAVVKDTHKNKPLKKVMDVTCVDIQPKFSEQEMKNLGFLDGVNSDSFHWRDDEMVASQKMTPMFVPDSFEEVPCPFRKNKIHPRVKPDILEYGRSVLEDESKTKWGTSAQDFLKTCPSNSYDFVSINNINLYMKKSESLEVKKDVVRVLKKGGILVTDLTDRDYLRYKDELVRGKRGIFEKKLKPNTFASDILKKVWSVVPSVKSKIRNVKGIR